ncbi:hypothetical protein CLV51_11060 [Chitinophaga niastensis]|uniref:Uncharacterized protein n=1 Tax=Chitinophaga niastensis TaxID=536980 RepID=A0A2P8H9G2_CHINA|nr:hypothetical protein [Chitinophaga niastensis]PSL42844.1 hypothetical protein CLV51_11060 [Chitinophaga niastensis]
MNKEEFVDIIRLRSIERTISGVKENLLDPPGRSPAKDTIEESNWFNNLDSANQEFVTRIIRRSVEAGVFTFLCLLDGVMAIENGPNKGVLKLIYEKDGQKTILSDQTGDFLHELI